MSTGENIIDNLCLWDLIGVVEAVKASCESVSFSAILPAAPRGKKQWPSAAIPINK